MRYENVCLESFGYTLPDERVTLDEIEARLAPLYERLRLPAGRLELMTGIRERRFWAPGTLPGDVSIQSGEKALAAAGIERAHVGALVHASVCRDHLEPATACRVHHALGLPEQCQVFDVSNACLGLLNGMLLVANMIELGQIRAGLVVGTEGSRQVVETTIDWLNRSTSLSREDVKLAVASLTLGSASFAMLLVDRELSRTQNRILAAAARARSEHHALCHSGRDEAAGEGMQTLMETDSERLLVAGIATGAATFDHFLAETGWQRDDIDKTFCHQVGSAHRKLMFSSLELNPAIDFPTVEFLGNTGAVALPVAFALAVEQGKLKARDRVAMLGIGSGINSLMIGVEWQAVREPQVPRAKFLDRSPGARV